MSNPNFHPSVELPFQEGPDGRLALDPLEAIQAAQEAKERRDREDAVRQSTEAFVGDLESPDMDAVHDLGHMQDQRAAQHRTEQDFAERHGMNHSGTYEGVRGAKVFTTSEANTNQYGAHYEQTLGARDEARGIDNRSAEEKHRDELIEEWAKAELIGDSTKTNDVQEELLNRVMSMKYVDDTEKQRMLDAQLRNMQHRQEEYLRNVKSEDLTDLLPTERDAVLKRAAELRASEQPEPDPTDPGHPERFDQMTDDEIRNVSPAEMEGMTEAERAAYLRNMHQLKAQDYQGPGDRDVHGAASGRRRPDVAGGAVILNRAVPAPGQRPAAPRPPRPADDLDVPDFLRTSGPAPVPPRRSGAPRPGLNTGDVLVAGVPLLPPRAPEAGQSMPDDALSGALDAFRQHTQEQLGQSPVNRALGRIGLGPLARRNRRPQGEDNQAPVVPDVQIPDLGPDPFGDNPYPAGVPANAGETGVPALPPVEVYPPAPGPQASRITRWWARAANSGRSTDAENKGPEGPPSIFRGTPRIAANLLRRAGIMSPEEGNAGNQAEAEPVQLPARGTASRGRRPTGGRRPAPQARPAGIDILDPDTSDEL